MAYDGSASFIVPAGRVAVIRTFTYLIITAAASDPGPLITGFEAVQGSRTVSINVNGVAAEGFPLGGNGGWPEYLWEQECFIICPENSQVQFKFHQLGDTDIVDVRVYGNLLPVHGLPPAWEIATMSNQGAI